jgi:hypothetical protein
MTPTNIVSACLRILLSLLGLYVGISLIVLGGFREVLTFTLQSNLMMAVSFAWTAVTLLGRWRTLPEWLEGSAVFYITITGLVYYFVLRPKGLPRAGSFLGWLANNNNLEHIVAPAGALLVWIVFAEHRRIPWKYIGWWLVYLVAYLVLILTLVAVLPGVTAPYPFLDVTLHGAWGVAWRVAVYMAWFAALAAAMIGLDRWLPLRTAISELDPRDPLNSGQLSVARVARNARSDPRLSRSPSSSSRRGGHRAVPR